MELHELTAHELAGALASGEASSVEAVESQFARIEATEADIDAYLLLTKEAALEQARAVDEARTKGAELAPLAGVPYAVKDVICTNGIRTTCGSKILESFVPPYDATVVERCRTAGLPIVGKTNMDEFAMGSSTENSAFKVTRNPWDLSRIPGGSSGGSAAAVAADAAFLALGTDTGGSIRQPASVCGIVGLKPTYGRVSRYGLVAYASSLDQIGPLTKDVRDCALLTQAIAGHDERDATSADVPAPDYLAALNGDIKGLRVGVVRELMGEGIEPGVLACVKQALEVLADLGADCDEVELPHCEYAATMAFATATGPKGRSTTMTACSPRPGRRASGLRYGCGSSRARTC